MEQDVLLAQEKAIQMLINALQEVEFDNVTHLTEVTQKVLGRIRAAESLEDINGVLTELEETYPEFSEFLHAELLSEEAASLSDLTQS